MKFECHITILDENDKVLDVLNNHAATAVAELTDGERASTPLSNAQLKQAIAKGALWHTRGKQTIRIRRVKKNLHKNDQLHFYYNDEILSLNCPQATLVADHSDYSVWYKPYGMLCQGSKWSDHLTIDRFAQQNLQPERPCFIVHRLDRAASGLIIIAHSKTAARKFSLMFEKHQLEKIYQIIAHGDHSSHIQPEKVTLPIDDKPSTSFFTTLEYHPVSNLSLIEVSIESGRKHQIRKHAASIGLPVVGDRLHGKKASYDETLNLQLCAVLLRFTCPISHQEVKYTLEQSLRPNITLTASLLYTL